MDGTKHKRRKSNYGSRHGRVEEKPKTAEVMNDQEQQDRLEAASALSSLMFLPPKSSNDDDNDEGDRISDQITPSTSLTQFSKLSTTSGIPTTSHPVSLVHISQQASSGRDEVVLSGNVANSLILAQLQNQLSRALQNKNIQPFFNPPAQIVSPLTQTHIMAALNLANGVGHVLPANALSNNNLRSQLPLTLVHQTQTVNQNVAKALRKVVSNNQMKASEIPLENVQGSDGRNISSSPASPRVQHESLPSTRKSGSTDTNLPLKKRRLIGMPDISLTTSDLNMASSEMNSTLDTLASARQIENILQMAKDYPACATSASSNMNMSLISGLSQSKLPTGAGYKPVQFDPRTSLLVLSDLKVALTPDDDGDLPLHIAVVHENIELVKKFIDIMAISGKTVDRFNKLQQTPLHLAVLVNQPEIVSVLLAAGGNPNLVDRHGCTSVHVAVNKQFPQCLETVFKQSKVSVNINTRDYEGYAPLHTCVELGNVDIMMCLIEHGADKDCQDGKAGRSVLLYAVEYNRGHIVQYLLDQGVNAELQNYAGVSPLMTAQAGNMENVLLYLNKALDLVKYEESYIPTKKVPIARIPSKSSLIYNKEIKTGRMPMSNGETPLIYEEYESRSGSVSRDFKPEPLSRQSSSSPIDLSMRHTDSPVPGTELSIRRKPGRRRIKKEPKNQKEKHSRKSIVKEKHASVVAALESRMFAEKPYPVKANIKTEDSVHTVEPNLKMEITNIGDEEMVGVETILTKSSSEALSKFILGLKPEQTKHLVEKVKERFGAHLVMDDTGDNMDYDDDLCERNKHTYENVNDKERGSELIVNNECEKMQTTVETGSTTCEQDVTEDNVEGEKQDNLLLVTRFENVSMPFSTNDTFDKESNTQKVNNNIFGSTAMTVADSPDMPVLSRVSSVSLEPDDKTTEDITIGDVVNDTYPAILSRQDSVSDDIDNAEHSESSLSTKSADSCTSSESKPDCETGSASSKGANETCVDSIKVDEQYTEIQDSFEKPECINDRDAKQNEDGRSYDHITDDHITDDPITDRSTVGKSSATGLASQISRESVSSASIQSSQGFESTTSPLVKPNETVEMVSEQLEHSDDSIEVQFSVDMKAHDKTEQNDSMDSEPGPEVSKVTENERKSVNEAKHMDTDDDEGESSLVIDENASEDERKCHTHPTELNAESNSENVTVHAYEKGITFFVQDGWDNGLNEAVIGQEDESQLHDASTEIVQTNSNSSDSSVRKVFSSSKNIDKEQKNTWKHNLAKNTSVMKNNGDKESAVTSADASYERFPKTGTQASEIKNAFPNVDSSRIASKMSLDSGHMLKSLPFISGSEGPAGVQQSNTTDDSVRQGQSHTLYYHDGDKYKPVKIFIDNSEQSSLVLQKMFQSAQLSNRKMGVVNNAMPDISSAKGVVVNSVTQSNLGVVNNSVLPSFSSKPMALNELKSEILTKQLISQIPVTLPGDGAVIYKPVTTSTNMSFETLSLTNARTSLTANSLSTADEFASFRKAYLESIHAKINRDLTNTNVFIEPVKKQTGTKTTESPRFKKPVSESSKQRSSFQYASKSCDNIAPAGKVFLPNEHKQRFMTSFANLPGKKMPGLLNKQVSFFTGKMAASEGTLTRVNPDVKSKLSKALQSPQRKIVRSDSDSYMLGSRGILGNTSVSMSETLVTSVKETRQQL